MFSLASNLLSTVASPAFEKAYQKGLSIWEAKDELRKLQRSLQTIHDVLLDAEKKQESSAAVKNWIERFKDLLYDADDLFDELVTDEMLKQQISKEGKILKKVRASFSKLNPIVSRNSIANQIKNIRKRLLDISAVLALDGCQSVNPQHEESISNARTGQNLRSFVDSKDVVGRENDKKAILELLLDDKSNNGEQDVSVIAIVGIGGMGKTTLAQLVYNDEEVQKRFEKRWFACISSDDKEIIGKIFQSVYNKCYGDVALGQLQTEIKESIKRKKFLLVLDNVSDEDHDSWQQQMSLLRGGAEGSKIIITTRSLLVARAMGALEAQTHILEGLSENESWDLFRRVAFTAEQEKDSRWANLGRQIVKKCARVPLAIRSVGSLLYMKATFQEWESFKYNQLSKLELSSDTIMQTLKLSYDHLPINLKDCFAYCSMFPKGHLFDMDQLIYLWIAQGYIKPNHEMQTVEQTGYSYFMDLHRRSFFQKVEHWDVTWTVRYKMHDLLHDLAQHVAGKECIALTNPSNQFSKMARHVSVGHEVCNSWRSVATKVNTSRVRSLIFLPCNMLNDRLRQLLLLSPSRNADPCSPLALDRQFTYGKYLRALSLSNLKIKMVSSSIGEIKHLRYLNLSENSFENLPDSLTNLLNLLTLDVQRCDNLKALPNSFRKLINLRHLNIGSCHGLKHMPPRMGELTSLQKLSDFKVGKAIEGVKRSELDVLAGLELRGELTIDFDDGIDKWDGDECWPLSVSLEQLEIRRYLGQRIPRLSNDHSFSPNFARLTLRDCHKVKHLTPLMCLPNLKFLHLCRLWELEYIEEEEDGDECTTVAAGCINNNASFFPLLEELEMSVLLKLKGWSRRKVAATATSSAESASPDLFLSFPLLAHLKIDLCEELMSFPQCPNVRTLEIRYVAGGAIQNFLSSTFTSSSSSLEKMFIGNCKGLVSFPDKALTSLKICSICDCPSLKNLQILKSPLLEDLEISSCDGLTSVEVEALPSLVSLAITSCGRLENMRIARLNALQKFMMWGCSEELDLWGIQQQKRCVYWDSLPNLRQLDVTAMLPSPERLPSCLQHRQALGQLQIRY